jgi:hypothetical protein
MAQSSKAAHVRSIHRYIKLAKYTQPPVILLANYRIDVLVLSLSLSLFDSTCQDPGFS